MGHTTPLSRGKLNHSMLIYYLTLSLSLSPILTINQAPLRFMFWKEVNSRGLMLCTESYCEKAKEFVNVVEIIKFVVVDWSLVEDFKIIITTRGLVQECPQCNKFLLIKLYLVLSILKSKGCLLFKIITKIFASPAIFGIKMLTSLAASQPTIPNFQY